MVINIILLTLSLHIFAEVTELDNEVLLTLNEKKSISDDMQKRIQTLRFIPSKNTLKNGQSCPGKELGHAQIIFHTSDVLSVVSKDTNIRDGDKILDVSAYGISTQFSLNNIPTENSNSDIGSHKPQCSTKQSVTSSRVSTFVIHSEMGLVKTCKNKADLVIKKSMTLKRKRNGRWVLRLTLNPDSYGKTVSCQYSSKK